jgi:SAM-dependent methyltransferase
MSAKASNWIPRKRVLVVIAIGLVFAVAATVAGIWSPLGYLLLIPAFGAVWAAFVISRIRRQLSPAGGGWESRIHAHVLSRLALAPDSRASVLDIGCGDGSLIIALLARTPAANATGVDFWGANWDYAQSACERRVSDLGLHAVFRRMDASQLAYPDENFDVVVSVMCFHEVKAPRGAAMHGPLLAVSEALRVLRPGGAFVLVDRFADVSDYGDPADLAAVLQQAEALQREPLVKALGIPWPLRSRRALGPVDMLSGRKATQSP